MPKTADEFARYFLDSQLGKSNIRDVAERRQTFSPEARDQYVKSATLEKAKHVGGKSPYLISYPCVMHLWTREPRASTEARYRMQIKLAMRRRFQMQMADLPTLGAPALSCTQHNVLTYVVATSYHYHCRYLSSAHHWLVC